MSIPRHYIVICRARRNVIKHIRGYLAELNDPAAGDTLDGVQSPPVAYTGDGNGGWQRPVISAPIPTLGDERLCRWGIYHSQTTAATRQAFVDKAAQFPNLVRWWGQQGTGTGDAFVASETLDEFKARVLALVGWIDQPAPL